MSLEQRDKLIGAIRRITVDADNDKPNGPAEEAIERLSVLLDPSTWTAEMTRDALIARVATLNGYMADLCNALADDTHELREAATAYFVDVDFARPEIDHEAEALRA